MRHAERICTGERDYKYTAVCAVIVRLLLVGAANHRGFVLGCGNENCFRYFPLLSVSEQCQHHTLEIAAKTNAVVRFYRYGQFEF